MKQTDIIVVIIPARGGSKRLPGKNIKLLNGQPMIAYAIKAAKKSKIKQRVIVSTDDRKIANLAKKYGAEVPFIRPVKLATNKAKSVDVLKHAVKFIEAENRGKIDIIVLIQPTSPLVLPEDINQAIETLNTTHTNCCVTVTKMTQRPEWAYTVKNRRAKPYLLTCKSQTRGQDLPGLYYLNGAIYAIRRRTLMEDSLIIDNNSLSAVIMPRERSVDIDELFDFNLAEIILKNNQNLGKYEDKNR